MSSYLSHERHQYLPRKRRGVENPCTFLMGKFPVQMEFCPQKCLIFADINHCKFLLYQIAVVFYWTLWDTHEQFHKKIVPSKVIDVEDINTGDWRETEWSINCRAVLCNATKDIFWFSMSDMQGLGVSRLCSKIYLLYYAALLQKFTIYAQQMSLLCSNNYTR